MASDAMRARLDLRRSNAAVPHRNRYRERKSGKGLHSEAVADELVSFWWEDDAGESTSEDQQDSGPD